MNGSDQTERELISLEEQFGEALTCGDNAMLDRLMADEFTGINPLSQSLNKHQVIDEITSRIMRSNLL